MSSPRCMRCGRTPVEIQEYVDMAIDLGCSPTDAVRQEEGTYDKRSNAFACTECYIAIGMPSSGAGWRVTPEVLRAWKERGTL